MKVKSLSWRYRPTPAIRAHTQFGNKIAIFEHHHQAFQNKNKAFLLYFQSF